jgi:23S rRNA pseudouridine2605 synthase
LITGGLVSVNGQTVTELGTKADPENDHIRVNGKLLRGAERHVYLLLNKPKGYVTTLKDPEGRPTIMQLLRGVGARVYPVGRLDYASEGLLLLTNDGELANGLMKAASHVSKVYLVKVAGIPSPEALEKLRSGVSIAGEGGRRMRTAPARIRPIREGDNPWYEVTLIEGKNRQIRKMFEEVGHHVEKIRRVKYGPLALDVPPGEFRRLTPQEVNRLKISGKKRSR